MTRMAGQRRTWVSLGLAAATAVLAVGTALAHGGYGPGHDMGCGAGTGPGGCGAGVGPDMRQGMGRGTGQGTGRVRACRCLPRKSALRTAQRCKASRRLTNARLTSPTSASSYRRRPRKRERRSAARMPRCVTACRRTVASRSSSPCRGGRIATAALHGVLGGGPDGPPRYSTLGDLADEDLDSAVRGASGVGCVVRDRPARTSAID